MNKWKSILQNSTGPACGMELAHGHFRPARLERKGGARRPGRASAHGRFAWPAWPAEARRHAGARAGAAARLGQRPAAVSGHGNARERAQETREEKASSTRSLCEAGEGRKRALHGGRARRCHGRRWRGAGRSDLCSEGGASSSTTSRKARRSSGHEELENGAVVLELDAGGARARRRQSSELAAVEEKGRKCRARVSECADTGR